MDDDIIIEIDNPYLMVDNASCSVSISSRTAYVYSLVEGDSGTTSTSITVYLEKLVNGSWQLYTSWTHNGGKYQDNTDTATVSYGAYRVWMSVSASGTGGNESFNVNGNTAGYRNILF